MFGHIVQQNVVAAELHVGFIFVSNFCTIGLIFDVLFCFLNEIWINFGSILGSYFDRLWGCFGGVWSSILEALGWPKISFWGSRAHFGHHFGCLLVIPRLPGRLLGILCASRAVCIDCWQAFGTQMGA